jgi:hypothetical protein
VVKLPRKPATHCLDQQFKQTVFFNTTLSKEIHSVPTRLAMCGKSQKTMLVFVRGFNCTKLQRFSALPGLEPARVAAPPPTTKAEISWVPKQKARLIMHNSRAH